MAEVQDLGPATYRGRGSNIAEAGARIDEQRIINTLEANIIEADTIQGSEISEQRQRNHVHYSLDRLGNEKKGRSQHITADVHDVVENQKALYREATQAGSKFFKFEPENDRDQGSHMATMYVNNVFFSRKNRGERVIRDALHDAFVAKRSVAKVEWKADSEMRTDRFEGVNGQQLQMLRAQGLGFQNLQQMNGVGPQGRQTMFSGELVREEDTSFAHVCILQPERYYRDPNVTYVDDGAFAGYQSDLARYTLVDMGFDEDEVMNLNLDYRFRQNEEDASRKAHDSSWSRARRHKRSPEQEIVTVYWHWAYLDLANFLPENTTPGIEGTKLYKFIFSQGRLLTNPKTGLPWEEATDGFPFIEWTQYKISHAEFGLCDADLAAPIQYSKSNILRSSIDNVAMNNTSRWKARTGAVKNPRELLDNNIGSVLWMNRGMDDLQPLPTAQLSPFTNTVYEQLEQDKEIRSGQSRLAKGMNSDAIRYQNADDMVERLTTASNRRSMMGVRDFCSEFLADIALRIYNLGRKYDRTPQAVEIQGQWTQIQPSQFIERNKVAIRTALTPDDRQREAQFLLMGYQMLASDPDLKPLFTMEEKHALIDDVFDLMGVGDTSRYMKQPNDPKVIQAIQRQQQQAQQMMMMQLAMAQQQQQMAQQREQREDYKVELDALDKGSDNMRKDEELDWQNYWKRLQHQLDVAEYELERTQQRPVAVGN